ncbi:hypothetical protein KP509_33G040600 [Ceratopteris richardii]|uniref:Uncharacterized protein n=1 Tax=Ceratopteris richardii TaxID=49495 RepID=A0A8T2QPX7_CERRI|nr:hypothetical protein KP509_33G040600 [Ceratopteris richardii]
MRNGVIQCHVCGSNVNASPSLRTVSRAYDRHRSDLSSKYRFLNVLLVVSDCCLLGLQPILVYMSKVDGKFLFSPVSVNFLAEVAKVTFTVIMLINQARGQRRGERSLISFPVIFEVGQIFLHVL